MATIKSIANQLNWECNKFYMYGSVDQYLFTARQVIDFLNSQNNCKLVYLPLVGITEEQAVNTLNYLKENKKELKVQSSEFSGQVLVIRLHETFKAYNADLFTNLTNNLVNFLRQNDIGTTPTCIYCNQAEVNSVMKINQIAYHSHHDCIAKAQSEMVQTKQNLQSAKKNYGIGMVGALLFAVVGAIPWMLLELFWGYAALLSLIIGYAAFYGYKKFGGLVTKLTKYLMLIPILFAVLVSNFITVRIYFILADVPFTIDNILLNLDNILPSLGLGILFGFLGYLSIFRKVKSEEFVGVIE